MRTKTDENHLQGRKKMSRPVQLMLAIVLFLLTGCQKNPIILSERTGIFIALDKKVYLPEETARLTILNLSASDLLLLNCGTGPRFELERWENGNWVKPYDLDCVAIGQPFSIPQGTKFEISFRFPLFANQLPEVKGRYRLKLELQLAATRKPLPDSLRIAGPIEIVDNRNN